MVTINIEHISPEKTREILNHLAHKKYIINMNCNYSYGPGINFSINSSINIESNSNDIFSDLAGYFS